MNSNPLGQTVALTGCLAEHYDGQHWNPCSLRGGLFFVDEWVPFEPSAYNWTPGWVVFPTKVVCPWAGRAHTVGCTCQSDALADDSYFIAAETFTEQVYPSDHAIDLANERDMAFAEEE